ncbi:NACHT, LRR and PYD domains-containing protein 12-like [Rhopilema esculentum]|uniref:NACHT, LRR and PYD domains-containing protein 12-like n=1 Tax=Rhopilema esculentum TaxID=499914 RepID=UPI0031DA245A
MTEEKNRQEYTVSTYGGVNLIGNGGNVTFHANAAPVSLGSTVNDVAQRLRNKYQTCLSTWTIPRLNKQKEIIYVEKNRNEYMVELRIVDDAFRGNNHFNELSKFIDRVQGAQGTIHLEGLNEVNSHITIVQGIAGIGKTSLVEHFVLKWANGNMESSDNSPQFDLVFYIKCRTLNRYLEISTAVDKIFMDQFGISSEEFLYLRSSAVASKTLIVLDGLDELVNIEKVFDHSPMNSLHVAINDMMSKDSRIFNGRHYILVTTRPHKTPLLRNNEDLTGQLRFIEVLGFDAGTIQEYVTKFVENDATLSKRITCAISQSKQMMLMARVPQLLCSVCCVLAREPSATEMDSKTEIFVWVLISFVRHHSMKCNIPPFRILQDDTVKRFLSIISEIAYNLLCSGSIEFQSYPIDIEKCDKGLKGLLESFLVQIETSFGCSFQFRHLSIHEFLAAAYCFTHGVSIKALLNRHLYEVVSFISGFARAYQYRQETQLTNNIVALFCNCMVDGREDLSRLPTVNQIAKVVLSNCLHKLSEREFLSIFHELVLSQDPVPQALDFSTETCFTLIHMTEWDALLFEQCIGTFLRSRGTQSISGIRLTLFKSELSSNNERSLSLPNLVPLFNEVMFYDCKIDDDFVKEMKFAGNENTNLKNMGFIHCSLTEQQILGLCHLIALVERLEIRKNQFSLVGVRCLVDYLVDYENINHLATKLRILVMKSCAFDKAMMSQVCRLLPIIEKLDISTNALNEELIFTLFKNWELSNNNLRDMRGNFIKLKDLVLRECSLDEACVAALCRILPRLRSIDLSVNKLSFRQIELIVDCFPCNNTNGCEFNLKSLKLRSCFLTAKSLLKLSDVISQIDWLDISYYVGHQENALTSNVLKRIIECLSQSEQSHLQTLVINSSKFNDEEFEQLKRLTNECNVLVNDDNDDSDAEGYDDDDDDD